MEKRKKPKWVDEDRGGWRRMNEEGWVDDNGWRRMNGGGWMENNGWKKMEGKKMDRGWMEIEKF